MGWWLLSLDVVQADTSRPNIVLFITDDMGIGDTRVYDEHCAIALPNIERLAREGMVFNAAHSAAAVCAPTRYSVLTGNYPWRGRLPNGTWMAHQPSQIRPGQRTIGNVLQDQGYYTMFLGKEHVGGGLIDARTGRLVEGWRYSHEDIDFSRPMPEGLHTKGFDYVYAMPQGIQGPPYAYFENGLLIGNPADIIIWEAGTYGRSVKKVTGWGMPDWDSSEAGPNMSRRALELLDDHFAANQERESARPFFMYFCTPSPHTPHTPPETLNGIQIEGASGVSAHLDMIIESDVIVGMLMDRIEEAGELENTIFIFTSDNGGLNWTQRQEGDASHDSSADLKGGKGQVWEGGHRVPFIVRWGNGSEPSPVPPGTRSDVLLGLVDLYATFAELTGKTMAPNEGLDSFSYLGVLRGREDAPVRSSMLIQSNREPEWGQSNTRAYREGPWKLVVTENHRPRNFFNLDADPGERNDLIQDPEQADRIASMMEGYHWIINSRRSVPLAN